MKRDRYGRIIGKLMVQPLDCPSCGRTLDAGLNQVIFGMAWWYRKYATEQSREDREKYEGPNPRLCLGWSDFGVIPTQCHHGSGQQ